METVFTVGKNDVGYRFLCGAEGEVGDEVLVFQQYDRRPYAIAKIDRQVSQGFEIVITRILE